MCKGTTCNCSGPADRPPGLGYASTRNDDKLTELEERIRQLEARPYPIVQPYPVPAWPPTPAYPFYPYSVWYSSGRTA